MVNNDELIGNLKTMIMLEIKHLERLIIGTLFISICLVCYPQQKESAAMHRYRTQWNSTEDKDNEFYTKFLYSDAVGLGLEKGVSRRDPSSILKIDGTYFVWYTLSTGGPISKNPTEACYDEADPMVRRFSWDYGCIAYSTSTDGFHWEEKGIALYPGPAGSFDCRSVFTPDIMYTDGKYYLYYQATKSADENPIVIAMAWSDSPHGPWHKQEEPVLYPDEGIAYPGVMDPNLLIRDGKYWLYYVNPKYSVAVADKPEGPFIKSKITPVTNSAHECHAWPYKEGVVLLVVRYGPEKNTVQYASDGLNFEIMSRVTYPPNGAGAYIADRYTNTTNGKGITWGLSHVMQDTEDHTEAYLVRFDCDLHQDVDWPIMKEWWTPNPGSLLLHERMRLEVKDRLKPEDRHQ